MQQQTRLRVGFPALHRCPLMITAYSSEAYSSDCHHLGLVAKHQSSALHLQKGNSRQHPGSTGSIPCVKRDEPLPMVMACRTLAASPFDLAASSWRASWRAALPPQDAQQETRPHGFRSQPRVWRIGVWHTPLCHAPTFIKRQLTECEKRRKLLKFTHFAQGTSR